MAKRFLWTAALLGARRGAGCPSDSGGVRHLPGSHESAGTGGRGQMKGGVVFRNEFK